MAWRGWVAGLVERGRRGLPRGFLSNVSWQYVSSFWSMGLGFLYSLLVARQLGPAEFGLMSLGLSFVTLVFQMVELRLHEAVIRYIAEFWETGDAPRALATVKLALGADLITGLLAFGLVLGLAPWAGAYLLRDPRGGGILTLSGLAIFFGNIGSVTAIGLMRVFMRFRLQAMINIGWTTLKLAATGAVLAWSPWGVYGVLGVAAITSLLLNATLMGAALWQLHQRIPLRTPAPLELLRARGKEMGGFVLSTYLVSLTSLPTKELDINLLGWFTSSEVVGVYRVAKNFMAAIWALTDPVFFVVYPELARMWSKQQYAEIRAFVKRLSALFGVSGVVLTSVAMVAVPYVIALVMGPGYAQAGSVFQWMVWGSLFWLPFLWANPLLMAAGRPDLSLRASVGGSSIVVGLYLLFIPLWSANGAALVYGLSTPIVVGLVLWFGVRARIIPPRPAGPIASS